MATAEEKTGPLKRVIVRPATSGDIPALCRLYFHFHEHHAAALPERLNSLGAWAQFDAARLTRGLTEHIEDESVGLFMGLVGDDIVGFVEIHLREDDPDPARVCRPYGYLQSLLVMPPQRSHGLGRALVHAAEQWVAAAGAFEVRLHSWVFPGDPVTYYETLGYHTLRRELVRRLDDPS